MIFGKDSKRRNLMTIGIDIDNVLNNLCEAVLSVYNEEADDNLKVSDITKYNIENFVKPQYKEGFYKIFLNKEVWRRIKVMPDCQKYILKLFNDGHRILFITKTEPYNFYKKTKWLEKLFPYLEIRKCFFCCPDKTLMKVDVLIDDCVKNFGGAKHSICFAYPWNAEFRGIRCKDWREIYTEINRINR